MDTNNEILDAIEILTNKKIGENITKILTGICKSVNINNNTCIMDSNGVIGTVQFYGSPPEVNELYRIFVPSNNMSRSFIVVPPKFTVNPNLLDNWYFGNPVDQRGGYVVPPGVAYGGASSGTTTKYYPVKSTYIYNDVKYAVFDVDGSERNVPFYACVRGYIPAWNGYSIDRWSVESDSEIVITLVNGGIRVKNTANVGRQFKQILPGNLNIAGMMITISALVGDVIGNVTYVLTQTNNPYQNSTACSIPTNGLVSSSGSALTGQQKIVFVLDPGAEITLLAAKLELGPTQTLAHKEGDRWVLNEVPNYGEQLRRCQEYAVKLPGKYWIPTNPDGVGRLNIPLPVTMRTKPAVTFTVEKSAGIDNNIVFDNSLSDEAQIQFYTAGIVNAGYVNVNNIFCSADL